MSTIDALKSQIRDYARPNFYSFVPQPTESVTSKISQAMGGEIPISELNFLVKNASLPSVGVRDAMFSRMGLKYYVPGDYDYGELAITFTMDEDHKSYRYFYEWMNAVHLHDPPTYEAEMRGLPPSQHLPGSKAYLIFHDVYMNQKQAYVFNYVYPRNISEVTLSSDDESALITFTVTFSYVYFFKTVY